MTKVRAALAGMTAALVAVGLAELVAVPFGARSAPLVAVGGWVIDHVPPGVKDFAISVFGTHDKQALLVGMVLVLAAFAALVGLAARVRLAFGLAGIGLFTLVGVAAALTRPGATAAWALPSLVGGIAAGVLLAYLVRQQQRSAPVGSMTGAEQDIARERSRRLFLRTVGVAAAGGVVVGVLGRTIASRLGVAKARSEVTLPAPASPAPALPSHVDPGYVTSNKDFYRIDTAFFAEPQIDPSTWQLRIHGMVDREITVTYADLLDMPMVERYITLACVSNEVGGDLIGNAKWLGVPVKGLLEKAGVHPDADQVVQRSVDGWTCGSPTEALTDGRDALLAVGMNGEPLPVVHGFPVRMVVPGLYGYVSACKWLAELEVTTFAAFDAYWVPRGWSQQAVIKTESRIDTPGDGKSRPAGQVTIAGVAWAQHRGISKVELNVAPDGQPGQWHDAELLDTVSSDTWRQWKLDWNFTPGTYQLTVRATDATGQTQAEAEAPPAPDGATGWHSTRLVIV
ncbi:molybdopterin-dependent oxidoreductase [Hamadaea tsunoensis]|uniref:molybdopterin-dependent oxidoreductase n=1 Tax=Hamadaea tsunoensis TaxID=53368 RepID=UPI00040C4010|nr:molybdopterin-dependent oxidoreductase [Hamadaea tsunoensis]